MMHPALNLENLDLIPIAYLSSLIYKLIQSDDTNKLYVNNLDQQVNM